MTSPAPMDAPAAPAYAPDAATHAPLDEVRRLVDERGQYEGWLAALEARGVPPFAYAYDRTHTTVEAVAAFTALEAEARALAERSASTPHQATDG